MPRPSRENALRFAVNAVVANLSFFMGIALLVLVFNGAPLYLSYRRISLSFPVQMVFFLVQVYINLALLFISLRFVDNRKTRTEDFWSCHPFFPGYLAASILFSFMVMMGLLLFIIPGVILAIKFQFYGYLMVDRQASPLTALSASERLTRGHEGDLFLFLLVLLLVNIAGALFFVVGLLVTVPLSSLALAHYFRQLAPASDPGV